MDAGRRLQSRQVAALGAGIVIIALGMVLMILAFRALQSRDHELRASGQARIAARYAFEGILDEEAGMRSYVASADPLSLQRYRDGRQTYAAFRANRTAPAPSVTEALARFLAGADAVDAFCAEQVARVRGGERAAAMRRLTAGKMLFDAFRRDDRALAAALQANLAEGRSAQAEALGIVEGIAALFGIMLIAGTVLTVLLLRRERLGARLARSDALTALPNRRAFEEELARVMRRRVGDVQVGLLFIDLDRFKAVNDERGHAAGDAVLAECGKRIRAAVRPSDVVARIGGDEFAVILAGVADRSAARVAAVRIRAEIARPIALADGVVTVDASIGIALAPSDGTDPRVLVQTADAAMYRTKPLASPLR